MQLDKKTISNYLESVLNFRDYRFKDAKYFGKTSIPRSINILNPSRTDLFNSVDTFVKDGYGTIVIYLGDKNAPKPKPKRVKQVFSSSHEVLHMWAAQTQSYARQGGRIKRVFFEGESCFSYGHHYELGRLVEINGVKCALINTTGYSHTTRKHIREAQSATSHIPQILVDESFDWRKGILKMQGDLVAGLLDLINRRSYWTGYKVFDRYERENFEKFNSLCDVVGRKELKLFPDNELLEVLKAHVAVCASKRTARDMVKAAEREAKQMERRIKAQDELEIWLKGGEYTSNLDLFNPQLIRIKGDKVETTGRATVDLSEARAALKAIQSGEAHPGMKIGDYEFRSMDTEGVIKVGCHNLSLEQVKSVLSRFKVIQGGNDQSVSK